MNQTFKPNDPKGAAGALKAPLGLIPAVAMEQTSWVHQLGANKYGSFNWRKTGVCASTYVNAIMRHLNAWREGEDNDPESQRTHLAHIACCCNILMDADHCGTLDDDRDRLPSAVKAHECQAGLTYGPIEEMMTRQEKERVDYAKLSSLLCCKPLPHHCDHDNKPLLDPKRVRPKKVEEKV